VTIRPGARDIQRETAPDARGGGAGARILAVAVLRAIACEREHSPELRIGPHIHGHDDHARQELLGTPA
jgi:hypothetical protein